MRIEGLEQRRLLAAAAELDPGFGDSGTVELPRESGSILVLGDDRILVMRTDAVTAYTPDGSLDTTFGTGGTTTFHFDDDGNTEDQAFWLRALPGGKFLVAGRRSAIDDRLAFMRFNADGSLDTTFGTAGRAQAPDHDRFLTVTDIAVAPDGKFIVVSRLSLTRFNANGTLDTTFGPDGSVGAGSGVYDVATVQADGKIVVAGNFRSVTGLALFRHLDNGAIDTGFGNSGVATIDVPAPVFGAEPRGPVAVHQQTDGKLVVAVRRSDGAALTVFRYNADGTPDGSFDGDGMAEARVGQPVWTEDAQIDADGNIVVVGRATSGPGGVGFFGTGVFIARFAPDGALEPSFGRAFLADRIQAYRGALGVQSDGGVLVRASKISLTSGVMQLTRFLGEDDGAADIALAGGMLSIQGSAAADAIDVRGGADATLRVNRNSIGKVLDAADVDRVSIDGAGGKDLLGIAGLTVPSTLSGGDGDDRIAGGDAVDSIVGGAGYDRIDAGAGHDTVDGGDGRDWIRGDDGDDRITGAGWGDFLTGGDGDDSINGGGFYDHIDGGTGNDTLSGDDGRDWIRGEIGDDEISGGAWGDFLDGGPGNDFLFGGGFPDQLTGGFGQDTLVGSTGDDVLLAVDNEIDELFGDAGNDTATRDEDDVLSGIEG